MRTEGMLGESSPVIRRATLTDAQRLAAIYAASEAAARAVVGAGPLETSTLDSWFATQLGAADARHFVAGGDGYIEIGPGELRALYVIPQRWGTGLAGALHDFALAELRAAGDIDVQLIVIAGNLRARRFYERRGWIYDGADKPRELGGITMPFARYVHRIL